MGAAHKNTSGTQCTLLQHCDCNLILQNLCLFAHLFNCLSRSNECHLCLIIPLSYVYLLSVWFTRLNKWLSHHWYFDYLKYSDTEAEIWSVLSDCQLSHHHRPKCTSLKLNLEHISCYATMLLLCLDELLIRAIFWQYDRYCLEKKSHVRNYTWFCLTL